MTTARRKRVKRAAAAGVGPSTLSPGASALAGEIYAIGGSVPMDRGSDLFVVDFDDAETRDLSHVSRRVIARFEVTEDLPVELAEVSASHGGVYWDREFDLWADAAPPFVQASNVPPGSRARHVLLAPLLSDGDDRWASRPSEADTLTGST